MKLNLLSRSSTLGAPAFAAALMLLAASTATAVDYQSTVLSDSPLAYYRLDEASPPDVAKNSGTLGATGNGTYISATHRVTGALAGNANAAAAYTGGARTVVPWTAALNPAGAFTVEGWLKPTIEENASAGQSPLWNRHSSGNRQGWVFFQRTSSALPPGANGAGWNFRMYNGVSGNLGINLTGGSYTVGQWSYVAAVWDGTTATLYVDGAPVASAAFSGTYPPNSDNPLSIGAYGANNPGDNPFTGSIDEVAIYTTALSAPQILAHYQNATNAARSTPYESLVATDGAVEYLRLDEANPAVDTAINYGSLGPVADAIHTPGVRHPAPGPLVGNPGQTAASYTGVVPSDGGQPTYVPATQNLLIRELWDNVGVGLISGMSNGSTSAGFDPTGTWSLNADTMITVAQDFDVEAPPGPPYSLGHQGAIWRNGSANWDPASWATRPLASSAWINFGGTGDYWLSVRIDNTGDTGMGVGLASGSTTAAEFVGVGAMWNTASAVDSSDAANSIYISAGTLGQALGGNNNGPYAILAHSSAGTINGPGTIVAHLSIAGGSYTLQAAVFLPGTKIPADPGSISWQVTYSGSSSMTANNLLLWLNGDSTGDIDAIRVATSYDAMFTDSLKPLNPSGSFTVEAWVNPAIEGQGNAQCPLHNRAATQNDGNGDRSGWDFFQRNSVSAGWNFRMFNGSGSGKVFDITGGPYTIGAWSHLVAVYDATVPSATLYLNGVQVAQSTTPNGTFASKTFGDLAIGSYSMPWMNPQGYENAFVGSIGQVAIYTNALSQSRIQAHYSNGTNASPPTPYSTVVLTDSPVGYWPLNEPAHNVATNLGTLSAAANGVYAHTTDGVPGPQAPAYAGFEANNLAKTFDGASSYIELLNPAGLNFTGPITLEAWVKPSASQNGFADFLAHGVNGAGNAEMMIRLTDNNRYQVGSWDGTASYDTQFALPAQDSGGADWVYVVGTYDGTMWNLYRNGHLSATTTSPTGALLVNDAAWALGARGRWIQAFGTQAGALFPDRAYTGGLDEVALYSTALSPGRIEAHWLVGKYGTLTPTPPTLSISPPTGGNVTLTWSAGVLQQADAVTGPYTDVLSATSPATVPATGAKFYRVRL